VDVQSHGRGVITVLAGGHCRGEGAAALFNACLYLPRSAWRTPPIDLRPLPLDLLQPDGGPQGLLSVHSSRSRHPTGTQAIAGKLRPGRWHENSTQTATPRDHHRGSRGGHLPACPRAGAPPGIDDDGRSDKCSAATRWRSHCGRGARSEVTLIQRRAGFWRGTGLILNCR
jgi:hypothetical protein